MYKIVYNDGSIFEGGEPTSSKWSEIDKPIRELKYELGGKTFVLKNYEMYNHIVEYVNILKKGTFLNKITLMGLSENIVTVIALNIREKTIEQYKVPIGREYNGGITTGWKNGTCEKIPKFSIK